MMKYHEKYDSFYNGKRWRDLRNYKFSAASGLCEECLKNGIVKEGKQVHHIVPIDKAWNLRYSFDNLICLCSECHNKKHERISALQKFLEEERNG